MPRLQTRQALADNAAAAALALDLIEYQDMLYAPVDYQTEEPASTDPERTIWKRQSALSIRHLANTTQDILFANEAEFRSFTYMIKQHATFGIPESGLLVPVRGQGVRRLLPTGELSAPTGNFIPATLGLEFDPDVDTSHVWSVLVGWLNSEDQAKALLRHLSVALQPDWTSSKYLLFIGEGSNGKSTLLKMLLKLVGSNSTSQVTRQQIAANKPVITTLNGSILNLVFDGSRKFLSDSASEKTLIAGEPLSIEMKFENLPTVIQTNALFIEGLNHEPRTGDHSGAIQRRLERFHFPNLYEKDLNFEKKMLSDESLSALLKLMLQHWVTEEKAGDLLVSTDESKQMRMDSVLSNNAVYQYIEALAVNLEDLEAAIAPNTMLDPFLTGFRQWADEAGYRNYDDAYLRTLTDEALVSVRKTIRIDGKPSTRRVILEHKPDLTRLLKHFRKED